MVSEFALGHVIGTRRRRRRHQSPPQCRTYCRVYTSSSDALFLFLSIHATAVVVGLTPFLIFMFNYRLRSIQFNCLVFHPFSSSSFCSRRFGHRADWSIVELFRKELSRASGHFALAAAAAAAGTGLN